jgi:hypothetical protein
MIADFDTFEASLMKKSRKHIAISTMLAILVLSAQTVFFPLHYYLTHHSTFPHANIQQDSEPDFSFSKAKHSPSGSVAEEGCYWCDLFAHQGYFIEKFSEFIFINTEIVKAQPLTFAFSFLQSDFPVSRGPPASHIL